MNYFNVLDKFKLNNSLILGDSLKRRNLNHKEEDQLQRLKRENKKLKQEVSRLTKLYERARFREESLAELAKEQYDEQNKKSHLEELKEKWKCWECKKYNRDGYLTLFILPQVTQTKYMRKCNKCSHRTSLKVYSPNVEGLKKEDLDE